MSQCQAVCPAGSSYNAVNIKINNPRANVTERRKNNNCEGEFNAVNLEINNPELREKPMYSYPKYDTIVTSDMANVRPIDIPEIPIFPVAYKTSFINNRTYISTDLDTPAELVRAENIEVPQPYLTTTENEKKNITFNGISFKKAQSPEIIPAGNIRPAVDIEKVAENLSSSNYDVQAKQLEEIIYAALKDKANSLAYISTPIFSEIINIIQKDTSSLEGPTEEQIDIRKKIITNEIIYEQQLAENKKPEEIELPYKLTQEELAKAIDLSELELAERNKEYAILTLAALNKIYIDEYNAKTGTVVPLTDLPGVAAIVEELKNSKNPSVKAASIEALVYINKPEYKDEIKTILQIAANDKNRVVSMTAADALNNIA